MSRLVYKTKGSQFSGSSYAELIAKARWVYHKAQKRTPKRVPYVRSAYFSRDKVFINNYWDHLSQKPPGERVRRLKLYECSLELIRHTTYPSDFLQNPNNKQEVLHRFYGETPEGVLFAVQVKENKRTGRKEFISSFPLKKSR